MPKKKRRTRLPNGFGSIKYLGKHRTNPYAVYPPVTEWNERGPITPPAIGYVKTWDDGYELLTTYRLEREGKIELSNNVFIDRSPTFAEVYELFYQEKYISSKKKYSKSSEYSCNAAFKNCKALHDIPIGKIKYIDLQKVVNECPLKHASLELIVSLMHQIYEYAIIHDIVNKDYSQHVTIQIPDDDQGGVPFSDEDLALLWANKNDSVVQLILIMCYSGYRISAYTDITINMNELYFFGGVKTRASKERYVPIHSEIIDLVKSHYDGSKNLFGRSVQIFRAIMNKKLEELGLLYAPSGEKHTPHDCRHTFSRLCEKYKVNENDRKRMMGHSFGSDITNAKYGHRTVEELREEIEKIKIPKV